MTTATVLQGYPASGKTTFAKSLYPALRFSMDDQREMAGMTGDRWNRETERVLFDAMLAGAVAAVKAGRDIVLDSRHLTPAWPRAYRQALEPLGVEFKVHSFLSVSAEECIRRDAERDKSVGEDVIRRLEKRHLDASKKGWRLTDKWMNGTRYPEPKPYVGDPMLPGAYLVDIDGTVAIHVDRGHYDYSLVSTDLPNKPVIRVVQALGENKDIVFVSGREDRCREDTQEWLREHLGFSSQPPLFMRTTGDHRPDYVVKAELFDEYIRDNYNVLGVFDDRSQVVTRCWRAMGIQTYQVAPGEF